MRVALLIVAIMAMVALASAQTVTYGSLKGTLYTDQACTSTTNYPLTIAGATTTVEFGCVVATGTGSSALVVYGGCFNYAYSGTNYQYWYIETFMGGVCPTTSTGTPTGTIQGFGSNSNTGSTSIFPDTAAHGALSGSAGCFIATSCSGSAASTLVVPSILLVALAFAARKLAL
jgi:hypothetical protein